MFFFFFFFILFVHFTLPKPKPRSQSKTPNPPSTRRRTTLEAPKNYPARRTTTTSALSSAPVHRAPTPTSQTQNPSPTASHTKTSVYPARTTLSPPRFPRSRSRLVISPARRSPTRPTPARTPVRSLPPSPPAASHRSPSLQTTTTSSTRFVHRQSIIRVADDDSQHDDADSAMISMPVTSIAASFRAPVDTRSTSSTSKPSRNSTTLSFQTRLPLSSSVPRMRESINGWFVRWTRADNCRQSIAVTHARTVVGCPIVFPSVGPTDRPKGVPVGRTLYTISRIITRQIKV